MSITDQASLQYRSESSDQDSHQLWVRMTDMSPHV